MTQEKLTFVTRTARERRGNPHALRTRTAREPMDMKQQTLMSLSLIVSEQLGIKQEAIASNAAWMQLGADSLDRLAISLAIEETFRVEIPHQVGERLNTVGDTLDHLLALLTARCPDPLEATETATSSSLTSRSWTGQRADGQGLKWDSKQQLHILLAPIISDQLGVAPEGITHCATWLQLGADSLDRLAISLAIEETFNVDLPHQVGERLNTVGDTLDHIWGLVSTEGTASGRAEGLSIGGGPLAGGWLRA